MNAQVVMHDARAGRWLRFSQPQAVIEARRLDEVVPQLQRVEAAVRDGWWAAGFISYEAAPAFDAALAAHPPGDFPLLWFGLYAEPRADEEASRAPGATFALGEWTPSLSRAAYDCAIARIKDYIARGHTYQVNYTFRLRAPFSGDAWALFQQLAEAQAAECAAYFDLGRYAICSASPELFFDLNDGLLTSRPMKGTAARGRTLAEDEASAEWLRCSEKDRAENVMIVDMIRNDIGRVAEIGSVRVPRLFDVERYPTVWQMTSTVTGITRAALAEVLQALFPCASITGAPKPRTMRIIQELEPEPRRIYCGAIGFIAPDPIHPDANVSRAPLRAQFNVAIRTVLIDREQGSAEYGVGSGIVWDSVSEAEYEECRIKARVLNETRPAFALLESLRWAPDEGYTLLDRHLHRLFTSAEYFGFAFDVEAARHELQALAAGLPPLPHKVRLTASRQGGLQLEAAPIGDIRPVRLGIAPTPVHSSNVFLYHKTTRREVYEAALAACPGADDVVLWNERGEVTETCTANLAVWLEGAWWTPPVGCGLLAGTYRAALLEAGRLRERVITLEMMRRSERLAVLNSVRLWREARLING